MQFLKRHCVFPFRLVQKLNVNVEVFLNRFDDYDSPAVDSVSSDQKSEAFSFKRGFLHFISDLFNREFDFHFVSLPIRDFNIQVFLGFIFKNLFGVKLFFEQELFHKLSYRNTVSLEDKADLECLLSVERVKFIHFECVIITSYYHATFSFIRRHGYAVRS